MNNFLLVLEEVVEQQEPAFVRNMIILLVISCLPWLYLIIRYGIFRRLRVRYILTDKQELPYVMLKKGSAIPLPIVNVEGYKFEGWFLDEDYSKPYVEIPMPNENLKLYGKITKIEEK